MLHGMRRNSDSLYDQAVDDWFEKYDRAQIKSRLMPYQKYIRHSIFCMFV